MAKKKVHGLYLRPDELYEKTKTVKGVRYVFRSHDPNEVWRQYYTFEKDLKEGPTFEALADRWKTEHFPTLAHSTQMGYMPAYNRLVEQFGKTRVQKLTAQELKAYISGFSRGRGYKTVANELLVLRLILDYACEQDILLHNPTQYIKVPKGLSRKPRSFPSNPDIEAVKSNYKLHPPYGLLYYFALYTGARVGELMALTWADVDMKARVIHITKSIYWENNHPKVKTPKTAAGHRDVPILDKLHRVLKPMKRPKDEYIFQVNGRLPSQTMLSRGKKQFQKKAGINTTPHQLRHAYATMLFEAGVNAKTSQYLLGHAQLSTTMDIYTELRQSNLIDAAQKLNKIDINTKTG